MDSPAPSTSSSQQETLALPPGESSRSRLSSRQELRIFQCLSVARLMSGQESDEDPISPTVYRMTIELLEKYRSEFSTQPSLRVVRRIWSNFVSLGSLGGKKPTAPPKPVREEWEVMLRDTDMSLRGISRSLSSVGVSASKNLVSRVAKNPDLRYYIKPVAQILTGAQRKRRLDFAHSMLHDLRKGHVLSLIHI